MSVDPSGNLYRGLEVRWCLGHIDLESDFAEDAVRPDHNEPQNILERIRFYDIDSKPIERLLTGDEKRLYLREIKRDITHFGKSYERAHLQVDIRGLNIEQAATAVRQTLEATSGVESQRRGSEEAHARAGSRWRIS